MTETRENMKATNTAIAKAVKDAGKMPMTEARYAELGDLNQWFYAQRGVIESKLQIGAANGYHEDDIIRANAARVVLVMWLEEKRAALGVTQDELDWYEVRQEGEAEGRASRGRYGPIGR